MPETSFDYIIIGAGSAGCVLADRLSADGRHSVLLLEAGGRDRYPWIHIPIGYAKTMQHPVYNWRFSTEPEAELNGRRIYWPRGKTLGGSSSINGLIYIRGQRDDYDHWSRLGNQGWSWRECLPYFLRLEHNDLGASASRGDSGPVWASTVRGPDTLVDAFIEASVRNGVPKVEDFNAGDQEGVGYVQLSARHGLRCSAAVAYLRHARRRPNLTIITDAQATRVLFRDREAAGVEVACRAGLQAFMAKREVLLCAGAVQTPQLLQLSGIGPADLLKAHGIQPVLELAGVGENLQDHLQVRVMYEINQPITINDRLNSLGGRIGIGLEWLSTRGGPMALGINKALMFCRALPEKSATPDVQFHVATVSADHAAGKVHPFPGCTLSVCQLRPESRGSIRIRSTDVREPPAIRANYLSTPLDRETMVAGLRFARRVAATDPFARFVRREHRPGSDYRSDDDLLRACREFGTTIFHPSGTAKMGSAADPSAVVDAHLRVHGLSGLRVVDCSIMPTLVSGNTNVPVFMIAEKAADMILGRAALAVA